MGQRHSHLRLEERCRLRGTMEMGLSIRAIARRMGRHRSTIRKEKVPAGSGMAHLSRQ
ncbi:MAG TPA: helix-turn-helix domain-containing protein [Amaricoccus sp.]|uniref:helix-turn-helix domain-containing protein n=1 Tax=Amaricoccus sp. TaxID=1872485 RepID=UPI002B97F8A2|nr:helix-turn-helix domain-containing protein [Amaricoccus sp.]HMQ93712.1 helix-turn-helix domain-containing protein [Amaricoccus sp.]HMR52829.1 helix-turn-helix domain-containing protein [Amaricoccus sp.]HMR60233.1 helix-turn-helix domain-containing protein [Amaricoccus sp.]HMT99764.1 helix-turn-helix domain-containing protein [Amaricoccus sp.]